MTRRVLLGAACVILITSCAAKNRDQAFFDEMSQMSKDEVFARGEALFGDKKWEEARRYFSFLADSFPNDPVGRRASLRVADSFFQRKDVESLTEAQLRYRDFSNRFPNDSGRPYALSMLGKCSLQQSKGPLRDLAPIREAAESFRQVVELYPDSPHAPEARELLARCLADLAEHEFQVARYYFNIHAWSGARMRLQHLVSTYPDTEAAQRGKELLRQIEEKVSGDTAGEAPTPTPTPAGNP
ncbi:MAG: outer membrane protein assembly factor BamD [Acidobacteriota bacterium]